MNRARFIINADDFGQNKEVNEAIIRCFSNGFLTSASVMMNGLNFPEVMEFTKFHKNFSPAFI